MLNYIHTYNCYLKMYRHINVSFTNICQCHCHLGLLFFMPVRHSYKVGWLYRLNRGSILILLSLYSARHFHIRKAETKWKQPTLMGNSNSLIYSKLLLLL